MDIFLIILAVVTLHLWLWLKVRLAFCGSNRTLSVVTLALISGMLFLSVAPHWIFGRFGVPFWLSHIGWTWLALLFWMVSVTVVFWGWNAALRVLSFMPRLSWLQRLKVTPRASMVVTFIVTLLASIWGIIEANAITLKRVEIVSEKIPASADGMKVAMISDLHIGPAATSGRISKTVKLLEESGADILVSAGDFIDGISDRENKYVEMLANATFTKRRYAVSGNHDWYTGEEISRELQELAGFKILSNEGLMLEEGIWLYGIPDPRSGMAGDALPAPNGSFSLVLYHRPDYKGGDLQLSGHSHGGQIFPFNLLVRLQYPYREGTLHRVGDGMMYVSYGTGVWGPNFRLFAKPEVTLFTLRSTPQKGRL